MKSLQEIKFKLNNRKTPFTDNWLHQRAKGGRREKIWRKETLDCCILSYEM